MTTTRIVLLATLAVAAGCSGSHSTDAAGPVSAALSSLTASPARVVADGAARATLSAVARDGSGRPVPGKVVTFTVSGTGNALSASQATTGANGVAEVTLRSRVAEEKGVAASVDGVPLSERARVDFVPGPAVFLAVRAQPAAAIAGEVLAPVVVEALDAASNRAAVPEDLAVAFASAPVDASFDGELAFSTAHGLAFFDGLVLPRAGRYVLRVRSGDRWVDAAPLDVAPAPASRLVFVASPAMPVTAGASFSVVVRTIDAFGNPAPSTAAVDLALSPDGVLGGATQVTASAGVATFTGLSIRSAGSSFRLVATSPGLASATSDLLPVLASSASRLVFVTQPSGGVAGALFSPGVRVSIEDAFGNSKPISTAVTLALRGGAPGAALAGTTTQTAVLGEALFPDLAVDLSGTGYVLDASTSGLAGTSAPFAIVAAAPLASRSTVAVSPPTLRAGESAAVVVSLADVYGNPVPDELVQLVVTAEGASVVQPLAATGADGIASGALTSTRTGVVLISTTPATAAPARVTFLPAPPSPARSTLTAALARAPDDGTPVTLTATVLDAHGNAVPGAAVALGAAGSVTFTQPPVTNGTGQAEGSARSLSSGVQTITASVDGALVATTAVEFVPAPPSPTRSSITTTRQPAAADGVTPARVTVTLRDGAGRTLSGVPVALSYEGAGTVVPASAATGPDGVATFDVTAASSTSGRLGATATPPSWAPVVLGARPTLRFTGCDVGPFCSGVCADLMADERHCGTCGHACGPGEDCVGGTCTFLGCAADSLAFSGAQSAPWLGAQPSALLSVDLNLDGLPDLVSANRGTNDVGVLLSILLPDGTRGFSNLRSFPLPGAVALAAGDVNGDGAPDLVAPTSSYDVRVLLGDGAGGFGAPATYPFGSGYPYGVALGDLDADGDRDVVVSTGGSVKVLLGAGNGTFGAATSYPSSSQPGGIALGDLDGDGYRDVVVADYPAGAVLVRRGSATGALGAQASFPAAALPTAVALHDVTGDGRLDAITTSWTGKDLGVLPGNGGGGFGARVAYSLGAATSVGQVTIEDVNGDGRSDVVAWASGTAVLLAQPGGGLGAAITSVAGGSPFALGDLTGDGKPDLVIASYSGPTTVVPGDGAGRFGPPRIPTGDTPRAVAAGDLDGNGWPDLVTANFFGSSLSVLLATGPGTFGAPITFPLGGYPSAVAIGDVNADGRPDLVSVVSSLAAVVIHHGNGNGTFGTPVTVSTGPWPSALLVADVDADGRHEIVTGNQATISVIDGTTEARYASSGPVMALASSGTALIAALSTGKVERWYYRSGYSPPYYYWGTDPVGGIPHAIAYARVDGDLEPDAVVALKDSNEVRVLLGVSGQQIRIPVGSKPTHLALQDVTGDSVRDLVVLESGGNAFSVSRGDGAGGFGPRRTYTTGMVNPLALALADVSGDGKLDVVTTSGNQVDVFRGDGLGGFDALATHGAGAGPHAVVAVDLDGDGHATDVAVSNEGSDEVTVWRGPGDGSLGAPRSYPVGDVPKTLVAADVNDDGLVDLATVNVDTFNVSLLLGTGGEPAEAVSAPLLSMTRPQSLAFGDFDGDGALDLVAGAGYGRDVTVRFGNGDGTFGVTKIVEVAYDIRSLASADLNGDGLDDVVAAAGSGTSVLLADGLGGFLTPAPVPAAGSRFALADLDGDGHLDLVGASYEGVDVLLGDGLGGFGAPVRVLPESYVVGLAIADVSHDGRPDVLVASGQAWVAILVNRGDATFDLAAVKLAVAPDGVAAGDLDRDGRLDLVVSTAAGVLVHRGSCGP